MGYEYVLIDNWWDNNIGRDRMEQFIKYARSKGGGGTTGKPEVSPTRSSRTSVRATQISYAHDR